MNNPQGWYLGIRILQLLQNGSESKRGKYNFYKLCLKESEKGKERWRDQFLYKC